MFCPLSNVSILKMPVNSLSVFLPAFNEEKNIAETVKKTLKVLQSLNLKNYELIVVDDGSSDQTPQVVLDLAKSNSKLRLVTHSVNQGYGAALKTGFKNSQYPWVAFIDADGQFDFSEITKFLDKTGQADLILGFRLKRSDSFDRVVLTFGWKTIARILLGLKVRDYSCGFKLIKKEVFDNISPLETEEKVTQIELLVKAAKAGYKFTEVGVHHYPRVFGRATGGSLFSKVFIKSIIDLFILWWKLR